jgi:hypothetical protein
MPVIDPGQLSFHPHSFADPDGRLFIWNGGVYRAIAHHKAAFFAHLLRDGILQKLANRGLLVSTELTDLEVKGYALVVRHYRVPFVSYPQEWCDLMFKNAALAHLELRRALLEYGLTLRDSHPWNLLFDGTRPLYVDITSIRPELPTGAVMDYSKFCRYYIHPLILMAHGFDRIARSLLPDYEGIREAEFAALMGYGRGASLRSGMKPLASALRRLSTWSVGGKTQAAWLDRLTREVEHIPAPSESKAPEGSAAGGLLQADPVKVLQYGLNHTIARLVPASILAIGSETLWPSALAASFNCPVVTFHANPGYVAQLYRDARSKDMRLLPLVIDFSDPTPARGIAGHISIAAADRLRCDLVVALGLVEAVAYQRRLRFDQLIAGLAAYTRRWLIVDWSPRLQNLAGRDYLGYTADIFVSELKKRFAHVEPLTCGASNDLVFLCDALK